MSQGFGAHTTTGSNSRVALLRDWQAAQETAKAAIERERELRAAVVAMFSDHAGDEMHKGMENVQTGLGLLKIDHKLEYKVENDGAKIEAVQEAIEKNEGNAVIADRIFKFKPELSLTEYKQLSPANKKLVDSILTITPASKQVKLVPFTGA